MNNVWVQEAVYTPQVIEDYKGNPLIEALPPIYSSGEVIKLLAVDPTYHEGERELEAHYRFHCIKRVFQFFQPINVHLDIEQRVSVAIRQSYLTKNPMTPAYASRLSFGATAIYEHNVYKQAPVSLMSSATGFTVIGMSGVGKSTAIEKILSLYPQVIRHTNYKNEPLFLTQLVWAKINCSFDGSIKGLCFTFFKYIDDVLGTNYSEMFNYNRMTVDLALPRMAQIATTHCLGLLVIDEIQHLSAVKSQGQEKMLNFFVTLVNTIGIPVVLIGTNKALPILQSEFRQARRGSGQGDLTWLRMEKDTYWTLMLTALWRNQWTRNQMSLTQELSDAIYDESQGIIDLAVKLYAMAQAKAIADKTESVTAKSIKQIAKEKLQRVRPMLEALKTNDLKQLVRFGDISPVSVDDYFNAQAGKIGLDWNMEDHRTLTEQAVVKLLELDIPATLAKTYVKKITGNASTGQSLSEVVRKAYRLYMKAGFEEEQHEPVMQTEDLRNACSGSNTYENLKEKGVITQNAGEFD